MNRPLQLSDLPAEILSAAMDDWGNQDPLQPLPGYFPDSPDRWLAEHHRQCSEPGREHARIVLLGDSITERWRAPEQAELWARHFAPLRTHIVAIGGDRTQQLLWRIRQGALDQLQPELLVLLAGVNNLWTMRQDNARVAEALGSVLVTVRQCLPKTHLVHVGTLPTQNPALTPIRQAIREINAISAARAEARQVRFLDVGDSFLDQHGLLSPDLMPDLCHLSPAGYDLLAEALLPSIHSLLKS